MSFFNADVLVSGTDGLLLKDIGQVATTPNTGYGSLYVNGDVLYFKTDGGTSTNLLSGGSSGISNLTTTEDSSSDETYSATEMVGGIIIRNQASGFSDTTASAALIVAEIPNAVVGSSFRLIVINKSTGTITLSKGTDITFDNGESPLPPPSALSTFSISINDICEFLVICTNVTGSSEAVTIYLINKYNA